MEEEIKFDRLITNLVDLNKEYSKPEYRINNMKALKIGQRLRNKITGQVVEVAKRDMKNDLLGMKYNGITIKDSQERHFYLPFDKLSKWEALKNDR